MEATDLTEFMQIDEVKILSNVRVVGSRDLNHIQSSENLRVQFEISGDVKGKITSYLCLDGKELTDSEKNYLYPLFTEAMNILVGRQISTDARFSKSQIKMSAPKISLISVPLNTEKKTGVQKYELKLSTIDFTVITEYSLVPLN